MTAGPSGEARRAELQGLSEIALTALTVASVWSFGRLFSGAGFLGPATGAALLSHLVARALRRAGISTLAAGTLSAVAGGLALVWMIEPATTLYGVPTADTWRALTADLSGAWSSFRTAVAPAEPARGLVMAASAGAWAAAFLADAVAFRLRANLEACVPSFTLFVFASALGADRHRVAYTALYLLALLAFMLVRSAGRRAETTSWFAGRAQGGAGALARGGVAVVVAAVAAAVVIGPSLPGAHSPALVSWRQRDANGTGDRITVSPLVDIKSKLVEQSGAELFTVRTGGAIPAYWRLTALDRFDGQIWSSLGTYRSANGPLPTVGSTEGNQVGLVQEFSIGPLASIWMPAAYRPQRVRASRDTRYDRETGSLLSPATAADSSRYTVESELPRLSAAQLAAAPADVPKAIADRYLSLPAGMPPEISAQAQALTAAETTTYGKARALQDWFRTNFTYDLQRVAPGHDSNAMRRFLQVRRGYCEQFAGTYAAMARAVGLPTRVAVGFQPGELQADGAFHVRGRDAHAWPEVYVAGFGWLAFEPTPGRGQPGAESYTGVPPPAPGSTAAEQTSTTVPTATSAPAGSAAPSTPSGAVSAEAGGAGSPKRRGVGGWVVVTTLLAGAALFSVTVPAVRARRRRRRRRAAATPAQRVLVAWEEAEEVLAVAAGLPRRPDETPAEYARKVTAPAGVAEPTMAMLARDASAAGFAAEGVGDEVAERARRSTDDITAELRGRAPAVRRLRWALDPRNLGRR